MMLLSQNSSIIAVTIQQKTPSNSKITSNEIEF